jgi:hypothetical protein
MLTAPALVPVGAHLFELPNKIGLSEEHYFLVQSIYRGWALFGIVDLCGHPHQFTRRRAAMA